MKELQSLASLQMVAPPTGITLPYKEDALQYLTGKIVEDSGTYYFVDEIYPDENPEIVESNIAVFDGTSDVITLDSAIPFDVGCSIEMRIDMSNLNAASNYFISDNAANGIRYSEKSQNFLVYINDLGATVSWVNTDEIIDLKVVREDSFTYNFFVDGVYIGDSTNPTDDTLDIKSIGARGDGLLPARCSIYSLCISTDTSNYDYSLSEGAGTTVYDRGGVINGTITSADITSFWGTSDTARPDNLLDGFSSGLVCDTSGTGYIQSEQAYGVWEFNLNKSVETNNIDVAFIASNTSAPFGGTQDGYLLRFGSTEAIGLFRQIGGSNSVLFATGSDYLDNNVDYRIRIERNSVTDEFHTGAVGSFRVLIKGQDNYPLSGDDWNLVDLTGGSGANPVVDNTTTESAYLVGDLDSGDIIHSLSNESLFDVSAGTGAYNKLYIPSQAESAGTDVTGQTITNPSGRWHNRAESKIKQTSTNTALKAQDLTIATAEGGDGYWYTSLGVAIPRGYNDKHYDVFDSGTAYHLDFSKAAENDWTKIIAYGTTRTSDELTKIYKFIKDKVLRDEDGSPISDEDSSIITIT